MARPYDTNKDQNAGQPLDILIVGAGIGGLAAAVALRHQGHHVTLFEQSRFAQEVGAAIIVPPNANALLERYDFFTCRDVGGVERRMMAFYDDKGNLGSKMEHPPGQSKHPMTLIHRATLHSGLKDYALDPARPGPAAEIKLRTRIVSIDPEQAKLTLDSGEVFQGDAIIGADGVNSFTRQFLAGPGEKALTPFPVGRNCFRWLLPRETLLADERTRELYAVDGAMYIWNCDQGRVVVYPCEGGSLVNIAAIHDSDESASTDPKDWNAQGDMGDLRRIFKDWCPAVQSLIDHADPNDVKLYRLLDMEQLPTWVRGRMALLGDAAHPFLPYQGQGGAQAIEDAVSLAVMLTAGVAPKDVPTRLKLFEKARKERAERIQASSRELGKPTPNQGPQIGEDRQKAVIYNWFFDEWDHSQEVLKEGLVAAGN